MAPPVETITYSVKGSTIIVGADLSEQVWPTLLLKLIKSLFGGKYRLTVNKYMADNLASSDRDIREIRGFERVKQLQRLLEASKRRLNIAAIKDDLDWLYHLSEGERGAAVLAEPGTKAVGPKTRWIGSSAKRDYMELHNFDPDDVAAVLKDFAEEIGFSLIKEQ